MGHFRALLFALVAAFSIGSSGCVFILRTDPVTKKAPHEEKEKIQIIDLDEQHRTSYHEAGHAWCAATFFGVNKVRDMIVTHDMAKSDLYGRVRMHGRWKSPSAKDQQDLAVYYHCGRAADLIINGEPTIGARTDLDYAMEEIKDKHFRYGLGRTVSVYEDKDAPQILWDDVDREINEVVRKRAEALVAANRRGVIELGNYMMRFPVVKGVRTMTDEQFRAFMKGRVLIDPDKPKAAAR